MAVKNMKNIKQLYCNSSTMMRNDIFVLHNYNEWKEINEYDKNGKEYFGAVQFRRKDNATVEENESVYFRHNGKVVALVDFAINYIDVVVMDAVYTLRKHGYSSFTINALIDLIFGADTCGSLLRDEFEPLFVESIKKLSRIAVVCGKKKRVYNDVYEMPQDGPSSMLPVNNSAENPQVYEIVDDLPLYKIAEAIGCIVEVDRKLLFASEFNDCVWKKLIRFEIIKAIEIAKRYPTAFGVSIFYKQPSSHLTSRCMLGTLHSRQCLIDVYDSAKAIKDSNDLNDVLKEIHSICQTVLSQLSQNEYILGYDYLKASNKYASVDIKLKDGAETVARTWDEIVCDDQIQDIVNKTYDDGYDEIDAAIDELRELQTDLLIEQMKAIKDLLGLDYCDSRLINSLQIKIKTSFYRIRLLLKQKRNKIAKSKTDK